MPSLNTCMVAAVTLLCPCLVLSIYTRSEGGNINQLTLIGTVEGKSYFAEGNTTMSWNDAQTFCKTSGLNLATISSVAQATLLQNSFNNVTFSGIHWTAGRDSKNPTQFKWDHNNELLNSSVLSPYTSIDQQTCLTFFPDNKYFIGAQCSVKFKVLCELSPEKLHS